jgi:DNA-directed RNA polymerase specialized sigma24 family protein
MRLLRQAVTLSRCAADAEDLLQAALVVALEQGRGDLHLPDNRRWLYGVMRNLSRSEARKAARRRARDAAFAELAPHGAEADVPDPSDFVDRLPRGLRLVALLALSGHTRAEIAWLLRLTDTALRKRLSDLARHWRSQGIDGQPALRLAHGTLPFGRMRLAMRAGLPAVRATFASHDPDGHLFLVTSQNAVPRQRQVSQR